MSQASTECPCGTGKTIDTCCGLYHGGEPAPTALALMRARYSAFVLGNGEYVRDTLSEEQKADFDLDEFNNSKGQTKWMGLEIRRTEAGREKDDTGVVEFVARYRTPDGPVVHHERAMFSREDGNWVFADCVMNPKEEQRRVEKIGRNEPCPCGSGKKYKKCCGAN